MQDQVAKLNDKGISACMIQSEGHSVLYYGDGSDIKLPLDRHENPTYKLFYMHSKMCVYDKKIEAFFNCILYTSEYNAHLIPYISPPNISPLNISPVANYQLIKACY